MSEKPMTLIERLKAATGSSRELDADIFQHHGVDEWNRAYVRAHEPCGCAHETAVDEARLRAPNYTASIDAALALVERILPGWDYIIGKTNDGLTIHCNLGNEAIEFGATPALAVLTALFTALEKETRK